MVQFPDVKIHAFDAAEIDQPEPAVRLKQIIAGVLVGMHHAQVLKLGFAGLAQPRGHEVAQSLRRFALEPGSRGRVLTTVQARADRPRQ